MKAKKYLGQHFLKSKEALDLLIKAGAIKDTDIIIEIGPGKGVLTEQLLTYAKKVIAIEKDFELTVVLKEKFSGYISTNKLEIIHDDILKFDVQEYFKQHMPEVSNYKLIANIPYYITGAILKQFLESNHQPEKMVLLVQKEVAQRIVAKDGKESILSMSVKAYGKPRYIKTVHAKYFSPPPRVDSAIVLIEQISKDFFKDISEQTFFTIIKAGFAHKRKMLAGNLKSLFKSINQTKIPNVENSSIDAIFSAANIPIKTRAEDIALEQWKLLTKSYIEKIKPT